MVKSDFNIHVRNAALFLFKRDNSISARDMAQELSKAYGEDAPTKTPCAIWLKRFRSGEWGIGKLDDEPRSGRPSEFDDGNFEL